jgi:hypothetical protein
LKPPGGLLLLGGFMFAIVVARYARFDGCDIVSSVQAL